MKIHEVFMTTLEMPSLVDAVYTRKVVVRDADEKVITEIYGPVRRFEIATGGNIE